MAAAAAEAPVGNHHVLAIKKHALTKVIRQMTMRRTRPMRRRLPRRILGQPPYGNAKKPWDHNSGAANEGSLPQLVPRASRLLHSIYLASVPRNFRRCPGWRGNFGVPTEDI